MRISSFPQVVTFLCCCCCCCIVIFVKKKGPAASQGQISLPVDFEGFSFLLSLLEFTVFEHICLWKSNHTRKGMHESKGVECRVWKVICCFLGSKKQNSTRLDTGLVDTIRPGCKFIFSIYVCVYTQLDLNGIPNECQ